MHLFGMAANDNDIHKTVRVIFGQRLSSPPTRWNTQHVDRVDSDLLDPTTLQKAVANQIEVLLDSIYS